MTSFNCADINQLEVEDSFQQASDWMKSVQKNVKKCDHTFGLLAVTLALVLLVCFRYSDSGVW